MSAPKRERASLARRGFTIATFNVQTLLTSKGYIGTTHKEELVAFCTKEQINTLAIQEHCAIHSNKLEIKETSCGAYIMFCSSAEVDPTCAKPVGGLAWLIHQHWRSRLRSIQLHTARILHIIIDTERDGPLHLINCYAPTAGHEELRDQFFETLAQVVTECEPDKCIIAGDLNSLQQPDENNPYGVTPKTDVTQQAADQLSEFLADGDLCTTTGCMRLAHKPFSFVRANTGEKVLLDYVITTRHLIHHLTDVRFPRRPTISDHWPVVSTFDFCKMVPTPRNCIAHAPKLDCSPLSRDKMLCANFAAHVLANLPQCITASDFPSIIDAFKSAASVYLKPITRAHNTPYTNRQAVLDARTAYNETHEVQTDALRALFNNIISERHSEFTKDADEACSLFETLLTSDPHAAYQSLKSITRTYKSPTPVAGKHPHDRKESIANICKSQLTNPHGDPDICFALHTEIPDNLYDIKPFTIAELQAGSRKLKNHKAPGPDDIYPEFLKLDALHPKLLEYYNSVFENCEVHQQMKETAFAMIPKPGGNHHDPANWRYIALMSYVTKLYDIMLRERLKKIVEPFLRYNQNGFRERLNTQQHILTLEFLKNALAQQHKTAIFTYIDFKNAFPSIQWYSIAAALKAFKVPLQLQNAILAVYQGHQGFVRTSDGQTDHFSITAGVLQGDTLAPYLFIIVLNEILRAAITTVEHSIIDTSCTAREGSRHYTPPVTITDLDYADDIVLINTSELGAQQMLQAVEREAAKAGLIINCKKTQNVVLGKLQVCIKSISGQIIENVPRYRYLGRWTDSHHDFTCRMAAARATMTKMRRVWTSSTLTRVHKAILFKVFILPTITYGMCTYPLTKAFTDRIRGGTTRMLKKALNIPATYHATLEERYVQQHTMQH